MHNITAKPLRRPQRAGTRFDSMFVLQRALRMRSVLKAGAHGSGSTELLVGRRVSWLPALAVHARRALHATPNRSHLSASLSWRSRASSVASHKQLRSAYNTWQDVNASHGTSYPLIDAVKRGDVAALREMTAEPYTHNVDAQDSCYMTALHYAAKLGLTDAAAVLLSMRANPNVADADQCTPLHWAGKANATGVIKLLCNANANTGARDVWGRTPLHWTAMAGATECVQLLLTAGAPLDVTDNNGHTALVLARQSDMLHIISAIKEAQRIRAMATVEMSNGNGNGNESRNCGGSESDSPPSRSASSIRATAGRGTATSVTVGCSAAAAVPAASSVAAAAGVGGLKVGRALRPPRNPKWSGPLVLPSDSMADAVIRDTAGTGAATQLQWHSASTHTPLSTVAGAMASASTKGSSSSDSDEEAVPPPRNVAADDVPGVATGRNWGMEMPTPMPTAAERTGDWHAPSYERLLARTEELTARLEAMNPGSGSGSSAGEGVKALKEQIATLREQLELQDNRISHLVIRVSQLTRDREAAMATPTCTGVSGGATASAGTAAADFAAAEQRERERERERFLGDRHAPM